MDLRKIISEEINNALSEGVGMAFGTGGLFRSAPSDFDHLKWDFTDRQKFYLQELCAINPDTITEEDLKDASLRLDIPEKNVKSIINTYTKYKPGDKYSGNPGVGVDENFGAHDSEASKKSRLTFGNKPASSHDIGMDVDLNRVPDLSPEGKKVMQSNSRKNSHAELKRNYEADMLNRRWYREGEGKEHPSKKIERMYESLSQSLMLYLYSETNPKDINLREDDKIQIDFEPVISEGEFNQLDGGPNYETEKHKEIKSLIKEFNERFGCSFVVCDHIYGEDSQRLFIEQNITKQVDMSQDSIAMMKKFLLPKIIMDHKIQTNDPSVAALMGLDAGDTTWLYGPIGSEMQSGVLSKIHKGRA